MKLFFLLFCFFALMAQEEVLTLPEQISEERISSYPYLSGDTWRFFADWRLSKDEEFDPREVRLGDTVFVEYDQLKRFGRKYLPKIRNRFVLITPNCENGVDAPQPGKFACFLESDKISVWFVQNIDQSPSDRLVPIPMGLGNRVWSQGQLEVIDQIVTEAKQEHPRDCVVYFPLENALAQKEECFSHFKEMPIVSMVEPKRFSDYLQDLTHSRFVLSPPGNGVDCHRTWESLLLGAYPIVLSSTLDPLYQDLPVVVVSDWNEVTEEFLKKKEEEFAARAWNFEKLYAPYWYEKVFAIQKELRDHPTFYEKVTAWFFHTDRRKEGGRG